MGLVPFYTAWLFPDLITKIKNASLFIGKFCMYHADQMSPTQQNSTNTMICINEI